MRTVGEKQEIEGANEGGRGIMQKLCKNREGLAATRKTKVIEKTKEITNELQKAGKNNDQTKLWRSLKNIRTQNAGGKRKRKRGI